MNLLFAAIAATFIALPAGAAVYEVGDTVEDLCWSSVESKEVCLSQSKGTIRVLLYSAGWCPPCNAELKELSPKSAKYNGKPVTFLSLSADGWTKNSGPSKQFLQEWKDRYKIKFTVAASPKDAGKKFIAPPVYIPNVAIIDGDGKLAYKGVNPGVSAIFSEIDTLLED